MSDVWFERRSRWLKQQEDAREPFDVDYARVVHSGSFRRLQGKTQILNLGDSDFYRTRLTHSLEVAQIAGGVVRQLAAGQCRTRRPLVVRHRTMTPSNPRSSKTSRADRRRDPTPINRIGRVSL